MGISFDIIKHYYSKYGNNNDVIHLVDMEINEVFWTGKVKDLETVGQIDKHVVGLASRHFCPKSNKYEDGTFLYVRRMYIV